MKTSNGGAITRQQRRALERAYGAPTCQACNRKFGSRAQYLRHVMADHHIPQDHKFYDFEGIIYDVTEIERVAMAGHSSYGPHDKRLTPEILWSISGASIKEERILSLTPAELGKPVLFVNHASSLGYSRLIDGIPRRLERVSIVVYLALGWSVLVVLPSLFKSVDRTTSILIVVGGALYSIGGASTAGDAFRSMTAFGTAWC